VRSRHLGIAIGLVFAVVGIAGVALIVTDTKEHESGIQGRVKVGCLTRISCLPVPAVGLQRIHRWDPTTTRGSDFPLVKTFRSKPDGTFKVSLPPGHYLIDDDPASPAPGDMKPVEIYVSAGKFTEVDPFYDEFGTREPAS
jgi:hypothetical protein